MAARTHFRWFLPLSVRFRSDGLSDLISRQVGIGEPCPVPCSTRRRRDRWRGAFLAPTLPSGCGAQRRSRAAPLGAGTGPARSHAQRPFGREHGEHGEDPPLYRSEHHCMAAPRFVMKEVLRGQPAPLSPTFGSFCYPLGVALRLSGNHSGFLFSLFGFSARGQAL